jgi:hypothetical protein
MKNNKQTEKAAPTRPNVMGCLQQNAETSLLHSNSEHGKRQVKKFELGHICVTPGACDLDIRDIIAALSRHICGDWGDICEGDKAINDEALLLGFRLFSMYHSRNSTKFYIITEWDRSLTTVLLPEEY